MGWAQGTPNFCLILTIRAVTTQKGLSTNQEEEKPPEAWTPGTPSNDFRGVENFLEGDL